MTRKRIFIKRHFPWRAVIAGTVYAALALYVLLVIWGVVTAW